MSESYKRELQALFDEGYTEQPPAKDFMDTVLVRRKKQVSRHRMIGLVALLALGWIGTSQWSRPEPKAEQDIAWVTEVDSMYDEHEHYKNSLLNETDGLAELPADTFAFLQLLETQDEE